MQKRGEYQEISCQQVLMDESSVYSAQWTIVPAAIAAEVTPRWLLDRYLRYIRETTFSLIQPASSFDRVDFQLGRTDFTILSFAPPLAEDQSVTLSIRGGALVQADQCHRGQMHFIVEPQGDMVKLMLNLTDYCPLLLGGPRPSPVRQLLYRLTQALIHRRVTVSFLARVYAELTGGEPCVRVVTVQPERGRKI